MSADRRRLIIRFDDDTREALTREAETQGLSRAEVVRRAVRAYVAASEVNRVTRKRTLTGGRLTVPQREGEVLLNA